MDKRLVGAVLCIAVAALALVSYQVFGMGGQNFVRVPLARKLTQTKAIELSIGQITGKEPLMSLEWDTDQNMQYSVPELRDIILTMKYDSHKHGFHGICAMDYNIPVSVCYMKKFYNEQDYVMYNLKMFGYSNSSVQSKMTSSLCDDGKTEYGIQTFVSGWFEYFDVTGEKFRMRLDGTTGRVAQTMVWLNHGNTICDGFSVQRLANLMYNLKDLVMVH